MTEKHCWADKYGFKTVKEYVDYMTEYGLWGEMNTSNSREHGIKG